MWPTSYLSLPARTAGQGKNAASYDLPANISETVLSEHKIMTLDRLFLADPIIFQSGKIRKLLDGKTHWHPAEQALLWWGLGQRVGVSELSSLHARHTVRRRADPANPSSTQTRRTLAKTVMMNCLKTRKVDQRFAAIREPMSRNMAESLYEHQVLCHFTLLCSHPPPHPPSAGA